MSTREASDKVKRNLLFASIFCGAAAWFEIDTSEASFWGIQASERLNSTAVVAFAWGVAAYHALHLFMTLHEDFGAFHQAAIDAQQSAINDRNERRATDLEELRNSRSAGERFYKPELDDVQIEKFLPVSLPTEARFWRKSLGKSWRLAFSKKSFSDARSPGERKFWLFEIVIPYSVFALASLIAASSWWT